MQGAYGLHIFDFWKELDRDLLGNVFERSVGDLNEIAGGGQPDVRQAFGIYYTAARLAKFAARSAITAVLSDDEELQTLLQGKAGKDLQEFEAHAHSVLEVLGKYRIADISCGSGVFLTAAYEALIAPFRKTLEAGTGGMFSREIIAFQQARGCYGLEIRYDSFVYG